jgi:hypothetical protein
MTVDNMDKQLSLEKLGQIDIPTSVIEELDLEKVLRDVKMAFSQVDAVGKKVTEVANANFFMKIYNGVSGKTTETLAEAIKIQGEFAKVQSALLVLNLFFAKELHKQQEQLTRQSLELLAQSRKLEEQHNELKELTEKSLQQQETIMKLNKLTEGQEQAIRGLLEKAEQLREIEERFNAKLEEHKKISNADIETLKQGLEKVENDLIPTHDDILKIKANFRTIIIAVIAIGLLSIGTILIVMFKIK